MNDYVHTYIVHGFYFASETETDFFQSNTKVAFSCSQFKNGLNLINFEKFGKRNSKGTNK